MSNSDQDTQTESHHKFRNDPEDCGHGGTIHLGRGYDADKQCKLCGVKFDRFGREV